MAHLQSQLRRNIQAQVAAVMLLLAALGAVAWALSMVAGAFVARNVYLDMAPAYKHYTGSTAIVIDGGRVLFTRQQTTFPDDPTPLVTEWVVQRMDKQNSSIRGFDAPRWLQAIGIDWGWQTTNSPPLPAGGIGLPGYNLRQRNVSVPFWFLIAVTAMSGWLLGRRNWVIRRRVLAGQCPVCGYDCRATPDHCPECGFADAAPSLSPLLVLRERAG